MRWLIGVALFSILGLQPGATSILGQVQQPQSPQDDANETYHYVPPSASKSVEIGDFYLRRGKYKAALSRYEEAVGTDSHYAPAYEGLGKVYERIGLRQKALIAYRKYLDELPSAKQAQEAKQIHKAIARLQKEISSGSGPSGSQ